MQTTTELSTKLAIMRGSTMSGRALIRRVLKELIVMRCRGSDGGRIWSPPSMEIWERVN